MRFLAASAFLSVILWAVERPGANDLARGDQALRKRDYTAAARHYLNARVADPKNPAIYRRLASVSEHTGNYLDAVAIYDQCLLLDEHASECRRGAVRANRRIKTSAHP